MLTSWERLTVSAEGMKAAEATALVSMWFVNSRIKAVCFQSICSTDFMTVSQTLIFSSFPSLCLSFSAVICSFRGSVTQGLALEVGETVQILEKCEGKTRRTASWDTGCLIQQWCSCYNSTGMGQRSRVGGVVKVSICIHQVRIKLRRESTSETSTD